MKKACIVKRAGHEETFDERKLYASVYAACLSAHVEDKKAEKIADKVAKAVKKRVTTKVCVDSSQIHKQAFAALNKHDKNAAFMYDTHKDIA